MMLSTGVERHPIISSRANRISRPGGARGGGGGAERPKAQVQAAGDFFSRLNCILKQLSGAINIASYQSTAVVSVLCLLTSFINQA
jgi:hypothetical protein